jgi:hypothetical protein
MQVLMILYKSRLPITRVEELFRERMGKYRAVPGLLQKLYVNDRATGQVGGIYVFDTEEHLNDFRGSDLEKSIEQVYQCTERPTFRVLDVVHALHEESIHAGPVGQAPGA